ncbi:MAG: hypothetical protein F6J96_18530 [Symploca sp. SIO1C2]|nr:hypothetical protein [Symploca sp. SIO1C2]
MTKILVWSIDNFSISTFHSTSLKPSQNQGGLTAQQAAQSRLQLLKKVLLASQPDIFVVIEVTSGDNRLSDLATFTGGFDGCSFLLNYLRTECNINAGDWRLVPPLKVGTGSKAESVGVFYRGTFEEGQRYFTGPNLWSGGANGFSVEPTSEVTSGAYPGTAPGVPNIRNFLVPSGEKPRTIPANALHNPGIPEDQVAVRHQFRENNDDNTAGDYLDFQGTREPYMVSFTETNGTNVRNLTLFCIHAPDVSEYPDVFMTYLGETYDIVSPLKANETRLVCGNFNLNLLKSDGTDAESYQALTEKDYRVLLTPAGEPPTDLDSYRGYFATQIKDSDNTAASTFLWSDEDDKAYYPAYGYINNGVENLYSVDNILVYPFKDSPYDYKTTILNPVVGTPLDKVASPSGDPPQGTIAMEHDFTNAEDWPPAPTAPTWSSGAAKNLISWANYQHIKSTSDHFALYAEV